MNASAARFTAAHAGFFILSQSGERCPYRKSHPNVLMVQTSEVRIGHDAANGLNSTQRWCILVQR